MLSLVRRAAQCIRYSPRLSYLAPVWPLLRAPYLAFMTAFGRRRGITVEVCGHKMRLHPTFCNQSWESVEAESYRAFAREVEPGFVVFDIGAHIGTYTIIALQVAGPWARVVAYEPHEYNRAHLVRHLQWNGVADRTIVRELCCGAIDTSGDFYFVPGEAAGTSGLLPVEGFQRRKVKVVSLDHEVSELGMMPDMLKIDVEGAEWDVLKGAEQILKRRHPVVLLSLHPLVLAKRGETPAEVLEWLEQRGFQCQVLARDHEMHVLARSSTRVS